jgi:hypothetical protein
MDAVSHGKKGSDPIRSDPLLVPAFVSFPFVPGFPPPPSLPTS